MEQLLWVQNNKCVSDNWQSEIDGAGMALTKDFQPEVQPLPPTCLLWHAVGVIQPRGPKVLQN